ncbi:MAG: ribosome maturation factor RimP [Coxiellaceae bacterium]|nr:ribosome maturation factor RimP [Coxiellaceae bacterium]
MGSATVTAVKDKLERIIEPAVSALGFELVGFELIQSGNSNTLRVYVDGENGIDIDAITQVSRQISAVMDVEEPITSRYILEVSSPGLDRPLYRLKDYQRFVGRSVKLRLRIPKEGDRRNYAGELVSVEDEQITLRMESGETITVTIGEIDKANLVPEF